MSIGILVKFPDAETGGILPHTSFNLFKSAIISSGVFGGTGGADGFPVISCNPKLNTPNLSVSGSLYVSSPLLVRDFSHNSLKLLILFSSSASFLELVHTFCNNRIIFCFASAKHSLLSPARNDLLIYSTRLS